MTAPRWEGVAVVDSGMRVRLAVPGPDLVRHIFDAILAGMRKDLVIDSYPQQAIASLAGVTVRRLGPPQKQGTRRDRIRLLGNGVCPPVMSAIVRTLTGSGTGHAG